MNETIQGTKKCLLCGVSFIPGGTSQLNCENCGHLSGDAHKAANQLKKALKLAHVLAKHGVSAPKLAECAEKNPAVWTMATELANVSTPSGVTQALTIALLRGAE